MRNFQKIHEDRFFFRHVYWFPWASRPEIIWVSYRWFIIIRLKVQKISSPEAIKLNRFREAELYPWNFKFLSDFKRKKFGSVLFCKIYLTLGNASIENYECQAVFGLFRLMIPKLRDAQWGLNKSTVLCIFMSFYLKRKFRSLTYKDCHCTHGFWIVNIIVESHLMQKKRTKHARVLSKQQQKNICKYLFK